MKISPSKFGLTNYTVEGSTILHITPILSIQLLWNVMKYAVDISTVTFFFNHKLICTMSQRLGVYQL